MKDFGSKLWVAGLALCLVVVAADSALADGCAPGQPCWEQYNKPRKRRPVVREEYQPPAPVQPRREPVQELREVPPLEEPVSMDVESGDFGLGLAGGVNVLFLNCEDTIVAPSLMLDYQPDSELPLNLRAGVEGGKLDGEQYFFTPSSQFFQDKLDLTVIRIPFSLEYIAELSEETKMFFGGGPDLMIVDGDADGAGTDVSDTDVGFHLAARVQQQLSDAIAISLEGGYLWSEPDAEGEDLDLNSAFTGVHLVGNLN